MLVIWNHTVAEVLGDQHGVKGIRLRSCAGHEACVPEITGLFVAIGHTPDARIFAGQLDMRDGSIRSKSGLAGDATATSVRGGLAAGDIADHIYRQALTTAGALDPQLPRCYALEN